MAAANSSLGASLAKVDANPTWARSRSTWARWSSSSFPRLLRRPAGPSAASVRARQELGLRRGQARAPPCVTARASGRTRVPGTRPQRRRPPRAWARPAERSSSAATSPSKLAVGLGPMPGAAIGIDLRRRWRPRVRLCTLPAILRRRRTGRPPNARADDETERARRSRAGPRPRRAARRRARGAAYLPTDGYVDPRSSRSHSRRARGSAVQRSRRTPA